MAERAPMAEWRPLTRSMSTVPLVHDIICLHTMVGSLSGSWSWSNRPGGSYWHFGVGGGGACWQCQDLRFKSAANLYGNWRVIPIETEDTNRNFFGAWSGHCGDVPWWTEAQMAKLVDLVAWLCVRYNIPPVLIPDTRAGRRGIAYHRQGIDPWRVSGGELWSKSSGKCCPDHRRIRQITEALVPRVQARLRGAPIPTPRPDPQPTPGQNLEDTMPYPVIACDPNDKQYAARTKWWALTPFGPYYVNGMERYGVDLGNGTYAPMRRVNARQYDVALAECEARAKALADLLALVKKTGDVAARTEMRVVATGQILERIESAVSPDSE